MGSLEALSGAPGPEGARRVDAEGWKRKGGVLTWDKPLKTDLELEVSWQE